MWLESFIQNQIRQGYGANNYQATFVKARGVDPKRRPAIAAGTVLDIRAGGTLPSIDFWSSRGFEEAFQHEEGSRVGGSSTVAAACAVTKGLLVGYHKQ